MARVETIVVGGGISAGSPFALNAFPYIANTDPPTVVSSPLLSQALGAFQGIVIAAAGDPQPASTAVLRVRGGAILEGTTADSVQIGRSAVTLGAGIAIGLSATSASGGMTVGLNSSATAVATVVGRSSTCGGNSVVFGDGCIVGSVNGATCVGNSAQVQVANGVAIGNGARTGTSGNNQIAIGNAIITGAAAGTVAIGLSSVATGNASCVVINGRPSAANQFVVGGNTNGNTDVITEVIFGAGPTSGLVTPADLTYRHTGSTAVDKAMGTVFFQGQRCNGNAATGGDIIFQTGAIGVSGATPQVQTDRLRIKGGTGLLEAVSPLELQSDRGLRFSSQTDSAGAAAGTLANAPAAGDPTFWLPVIVNGVSLAIPCWPG